MMCSLEDLVMMTDFFQMVPSASSACSMADQLADIQHEDRKMLTL